MKRRTTLLIAVIALATGFAVGLLIPRGERWKVTPTNGMILRTSMSTGKTQLWVSDHWKTLEGETPKSKYVTLLEKPPEITTEEAAAFAKTLGD